MDGSETTDTDEKADTFRIIEVDINLKSPIGCNIINTEDCQRGNEEETHENSCDRIIMESDCTGERLHDTSISVRVVNDTSPCPPECVANTAVSEEMRTENCNIDGNEWIKVDVKEFIVLPKKVPYNDTFFNKNSKKKRKGIISEESNTGTEKKKKWKHLALEDVGIRPTLFPRAVSTETSRCMMQEYEMFVETDFNEIEKKITNKVDFEVYESLKVKRIRPDRHQKVRKPGKQVKDKYCRSVRHNNGMKLFIHHRVFKLIVLTPQRWHFIPKPKPNNTNALRAIGAKADSTTVKITKLKNTPDKPSPPSATESKHALHSQNLPSFISSEQGLADLLISLQHRDLSPEDYELLLRLDEQVAPKTVCNKTLSQFRTEQATQSDCGEYCAICMEVYSIGHELKYLPCEHRFHSGCIDMWLENSSLNCPLDGLPVDQ